MGGAGRSSGRIGPLHLAVEPYVHCPRGGLVPLARCEACDLMHGSVVADGAVQVLCAYPEPVPPIHRQPAPRRGTLLRAVGPGTAARAGDELSHEAASLVFETDWPDE